METTGKNTYQAYQRGKIMDVLDDAKRKMTADEIAEAAGLSTQCTQKHLQRLAEKGMCHHVWKAAEGRQGRVFLYGKGRLQLAVVRDPIIAALTLGMQ